MPRFFVEPNDIISTENGAEISIHEDDAVHITKVLRMKVGEHLTACDTDGFEYETVIKSLGETVTLDVLSKKISENEPSYTATVYQSLVRGERFDTVLQKATELGAKRIVPVITSRCTVRLEKKEYEKKVTRWQRIVLEAAKQCGRASVPVVTYPVTFAEAIKESAQADLALFCYEGEGTLPITLHTQKVDNPNSVSIMIGPEGGYSEDEATLAKESGMKMTGLGRRILRTETAAPFVLSCLSYKYEL
jgi:16S rRNA (uracil1498-N3)-methyltransferase